MAKMLIRGGDLDLVEYDFEPFSLGEHINDLGLKKEYQLTIHQEMITAILPARIHLTVLDMNRFAPNRPGGGGIGFALQLYSTVEVTCCDGESEIDYERAPIIAHSIEVFKHVTGYKGGFRVRVVDHERRHIGLGSTGSVLTGLYAAMNKAVGSPLGSEEFRLLMGNNYVEETADGQVVPGFETGVGPAVVLYGGMSVMGDELSLVCNHPFGSEHNVFIIIPPTDACASGEDEFHVLMNRARSLDYRDRELKAYMVLMDLIPALCRDDVTKIGEVIWEIEFRGSKRAEVEHNSFEIYHYMSKLREAGLEFVGMSSVGPSISVVTKKSRTEVDAIVENMGLSVAIETNVDNVGIRLS